MCGGRHISPVGLLIGGLTALQPFDDRTVTAQRRTLVQTADKSDNCVVCGETIHPAYQWCPTCGSPQRLQPCAHCGQLMKPEVEMCSYCGAPRT